MWVRICLFIIIHIYIHIFFFKFRQWAKFAFLIVDHIHQGFLCLHILPIVYERFEDDIDRLVGHVILEMKKLYMRFDTNFLDKIPRGTVKEKKLRWKLNIIKVSFVHSQLYSARELHLNLLTLNPSVLTFLHHCKCQSQQKPEWKIKISSFNFLVSTYLHGNIHQGF